KDRTVVFAQWYGKIGTILFVAAFAMLFFLNSNQRNLAELIFIIPVAWSLYACFRYASVYFRRHDKTQGQS
ncbi:MAG TPA: hypothetical protein DCM45_02365, partial [Clostridiales bacterium]|nr:hypothetical protein [Clostridiales bacterium]